MKNVIIPTSPALSSEVGGYRIVVISVWNIAKNYMLIASKRWISKINLKQFYKIYVQTPAM